MRLALKGGRPTILDRPGEADLSRQGALWPGHVPDDDPVAHPLTSLLLTTKFFVPVNQPMPSRYAAKRGTWWIYATINALIGGITYPLLTQYTGLSDKIQGIIPG